MEREMEMAIEDAVTRAFSAGVGDKRFIDVSRIPLICQSIIGIDRKLEQIVTQDQFQPVKIIAYGMVSTVMLGVLGAILTTILK